MLTSPRPLSFERPIPTLITCDPVQLSDDCTKIAMTVGGEVHTLPLMALGAHAVGDIAAPFLEGQLTCENVTSPPGMPPGRYVFLKHGDEALAAFYLGDG